MGCTESRPEISGFQYAVPINPLTSAVGESQIFRNPDNKHELTHTLNGEPEILTMYDAYLRCFTKFANKNYLGTRESLADGKLGEYKFKTYAQVQDLATRVGSGMLNLGLNSETHTDGDFIIIWSKNREEWLVTDIACVLYKMCLVPMYDTLGPETITHIFSQTRSSTLIVAPENLDSALQNARKFETLKNIIVFGSATAEQRDKAKAANLRLFTYDEVLTSGNQRQPFRKPDPEDLYTLNYTSGTTGLPKGGMITHRNQLASSSAAINRTDLAINSSDVYISYLPLAHTFERTAIFVMALAGCGVGFLGKDVQKISDDLAKLKPTIFVGVPRLFNKFYEKMQEGLARLTGAKKSLAETAISTKLENLKQSGSFHHTLYDTLVFNKMRQALGGKVRLMLNGGAPIEPEIESFLRIAICAPLVSGYGQTETTAASFISRADLPSFGHTGGPQGCVEYKVVDVPEMNYTSEDRDSLGLPTPRGEICMRGPAVFKGYYKDPERTAETLDKDGWVHTGDIGRINADGSLSIIDRKKNIFKLAQGEYVASEKVENIYLTVKYVAEAFLYGDSLKTHCVAIIVPSKEQIVELGKELNLQHLSFEQLCENAQVKSKVLKEMTQKGKDSKIPSFELAKQIYLDPVSFGQKGLLTPTFKLVRHSAKQYYQKVIDELYRLPLSSSS